MKKLLAVIGLALLTCVSAKAQNAWVTSVPAGSTKVSPYHVDWFDETTLTFNRTATYGDTTKEADYFLKGGVHYFYVFDKGTPNEQIAEVTPEVSVYSTIGIPVSVSPRGRVAYTDFTLVVYKHD